MDVPLPSPTDSGTTEKHVCGICESPKEAFEIIDGVCESCEPVFLAEISRISRTAPPSMPISQLFSLAAEQASARVKRKE